MTSHARQILEQRLNELEGRALNELWSAFPHQTVIQDREDFRLLVQQVGIPITWRLWRIVLDEVDRLSR